MGTITYLNGMLIALIFAFVAVISVNIVALLIHISLRVYAKSRKLKL
jgi:hypothetical protein